MEDELEIEISFDINDEYFYEYVTNLLKYRKSVYKSDNVNIYNIKDPLIPGVKWIISKNKVEKKDA